MSGRGLHLVRTAINSVALQAFAARQGAGDDDLGYALHLALRRRYGTAAPQPFRLLPGRDGTHDVLLGYAQALDALHAADPRRAGGASPDPLPAWDAAWGADEDSYLAAVFPLAFEAKPMPRAWGVGARYGFEARLRPVVRYGPQVLAARKAAGAQGKTERDAFLVALERRDAAGGDHHTDPLERDVVYRAWLEQRLLPAAALDRLRLVSHRRIETVRAAGTSGARPRRRFEGPETVVEGVLEVADPAAFAALLARGVGRHAAFGFGMLLLKPAGR